MRSHGISVQRIALPLLILALFICVFIFFWNERLVPAFAHQAQIIFKTEVKNKQQKSLFGTADIWIRGDGSFINIDNFDTTTSTLRGITIFLLNRDLSMRGLMAIPRARWNGQRWEDDARTEWHLFKEGRV